MVVSVSGGSPRFLMSDSRSAMIFLKVRKSSSPFITDCTCRQMSACLQFEVAQGQTAGSTLQRLCCHVVRLSLPDPFNAETELALLDMTNTSRKCDALHSDVMGWHAPAKTACTSSGD